jgi:hypothetical protein
MKLVVDKLVSGFLASLPKRQQEVLEGRYGLKNGREMTLAALGTRYGVTRERIRQIQNLSLNDIRSKSKENGLNAFADLVSSHLASLGGLRRDDMLVADVAKLAEDRGDKNTFGNRVRFLLESSNKAEYHPADKDYFAFWVSGEGELKRAEKFIETLEKSLSAKKEAVLAEKKFDFHFADAAKANSLKENVAENYVAVSKKFMANSYGDMGLSAWAEINPKTSRDFAYLVIKKEGKPLHFTSIAERINGIRKNKKTNFQTVHNELIKDERFVLVGRGTYGLAEFGIMPGTAKEVMAAILKENGPLKSRDLVKLVLERRIFKENTLLLNLQNKNFFKRGEDGKYFVKEA